MKKHGILNRRLSEVVAGMGHGDMLVVSDAGLPVPPGVELVDLAVAANVPRFLDVLRAVAGELQVEAIVVAQELREARGREENGSLDGEIAAMFPAVTRRHVPHEEFKALTARAKAIVRTGEFTPYANVILHSGVVF